MTAQVRTIVALTGERLVVMPEADYEALLVAARELETRPRSARAAEPAAVRSPDVARAQIAHAQVAHAQVAHTQVARTQAPGTPSVTLEQVLLRA